MSRTCVAGLLHPHVHIILPTQNRATIILWTVKRAHCFTPLPLAGVRALGGGIQNSALELAR